MNSKVWIYMSTDSASDDAFGISAVSVFATKEKAVACMKNTIAEDISSGIVEEDAFDYDGSEDGEGRYEAFDKDGRFYHCVSAKIVE